MRGVFTEKPMYLNSTYRFSRSSNAAWPRNRTRGISALGLSAKCWSYCCDTRQVRSSSRQSLANSRPFIGVTRLLALMPWADGEKPSPATTRLWPSIAGCNGLAQQGR